MDVILLAGNQPIKNSEKSENKALININGKMMIEYVTDALQKSVNVDRTVIVGPKDILKPHFREPEFMVIESAGSSIDNIVAGVNFLGTESHLLICTSDIPFLTPQSIDDFINRSRSLDADLCYPIVEKSVNEKVFPDMERSYTKIKEGRFTGGNLFYINPKIIPKGYELADSLSGSRKSSWKMARIISFRILIQLILGTLTIQKIETRVSKMLDIKAKAIISDYPELCSDVDKLSDLIAATATLSK